MSGQYFSVGEDVILSSKTKPELNGEYTISHAFILGSDGRYVCPVLGIKCRTISSTSKYLYYLHGANYVIESSEVEKPRPVSQLSLRKKHEGGVDFNVLMTSLNNSRCNEAS
jgi:hypothetical protein